jgi:hypothetical protein
MYIARGFYTSKIKNTGGEEDRGALYQSGILTYMFQYDTSAI